MNSLLGLLPPSYLLTTPVSEIFNDINLTAGIQGVYNAPGTLPPFPNTQSLLATIGTLLLAAPLNLGTPPQLFLTLQNNDLPILAPLRLPAQPINAALDGLAAAFAPLGSSGLPFRLGTPIADILQPALKILVNIAYPDVVTPTDVANDPTLVSRGYCALGGVCYDRTFAQTPTEFSLMGHLTPQEMLQVPGDVLNALVTGITQQLAKPFFGIIEPAPCVGCTPTAAVTPPVAAPAPAPSSAATAESVTAEAVADPAPTAVAAVTAEPAAEAPSAVSEVRAVRQSRAVRAPAAATPVRGEATAAAAEKDADDSPARTRAVRASR